MRRALLLIVLLLVGSTLLTLPAAAQNEADLAVTKTASPSPVTVGATLTYTVQVTNNGPSEADQIHLTDTISGNVSVGSASASQGSCQEAPGAVTCDLGTAAVGSTVTVTVSVAATSPGTVSNTASAQGAGPDPDPSNDSASTDTTATGQACTQLGTWDADEITGTGGPDVLCGLGGPDRLEGEGQQDTLYGGAGDDVLSGGGGPDTLDGQEDSDTAQFVVANRVVADLDTHTASGEGRDSFASVENLTGSAGDDVLRGSAGANRLLGRGGTDLLFGRDGNDHLSGGNDSDYLKGGGGGDGLDGGAGVDTCYQGPGSGQRRSCFGNLIPDGDDTRGVLDMGRVTLRPLDHPVWKIRTRSRWTPFGIWDRGFFLVLLDTKGGDTPEYHALVRSNGSRMVGVLFHGNRPAGPLAVARPDSHSVSVRVPLGRLRFGATHAWFGWQVETIYNVCGGGACFDLVADGGAAVQPAF